MAKVMLAMGMVVAYSYAVEAFTGWYSGNVFELALPAQPLVRPLRGTLLALALLQRRRQPAPVAQTRAPQPAGAVRDRGRDLNVGMWLERYVIIVPSLSRDFLPRSWGLFHPI